MRSPVIPQSHGDPLGREPHSYDELRRLTARYAKNELVGRALTNHPTQLAITLTSEALAAATQPGAPAALLRAIPELPHLLSYARYVRTVADRGHRPEVRRIQLLSAPAEIEGRPVELLFAVRENFNGQCFLDRFTVRNTPEQRRQDGGGTPDGADAPVSSDTGAVPASNADNANAAAAPSPYGTPLIGKASFYGAAADGRIGRPMANGQPMDPDAMTAAVRPNSIPLGSTVDVCLTNDPSRCVTVEITDHGMVDYRASQAAGAWVEDPKTTGRVIDLSRGAFEALTGKPAQGLTDVAVLIQRLPDKIRYFSPKK